MLFAFTSLLCSQTSARQATVLPLPGLPDWQVRRYRSEEELRADWPAAGRPDNFWLRPEVLAYQLNHPQGVRTAPVVVENRYDGRRILLTTQSFYFNAGGQVSDEAKGETSGYDLRRRLLAPFSFRVLCLGQFLVSGNYASDGTEQLTDEEATKIIPALADTLLSCCGSYAAVLIKDIYAEESAVTRQLRQNGYHLLPTDPTFHLVIPEAWRTMADYAAALKSKYRVRYRRARGKLEGLTRRRLLPAEAGHYRERIYELYQTTSSGSDFNAVALTPGYFPWLAESAPVNTLLHGYFDGGRLVGFTSAIPSGDVLHAHFLGMEDEYKRSHHLYHNMLFDLLEDAIAGGFRELDYARTAAEIKTSVGAVASHPACLLRARSGIINRLVPVFTPAVYRRPEWTPRNPFPG